MSERPYMPLFIDAFLADTMHLSCEEIGAYMLLLMSMWRHNGKVPDNDKDNARITRLSVRKWKAVKERLLPLLICENAEITQKRLQKEWKYVREISELQRQKGVKSGIARRNKNNNLNGTDVSARFEPETNPHTYTHKNTTPNGVVVSAPSRSDPQPIQKAFEHYNTAAKELGLPLAEKLTPERQRHVRARLKEHGLEGFDRMLLEIEQSSFLQGEGGRAWRPNLDWLCKPTNFNKVVEGGYRDRGD